MIIRLNSHYEDRQELFILTETFAIKFLNFKVLIIYLNLNLITCANASNNNCVILISTTLNLQITNLCSFTRVDSLREELINKFKGIREQLLPGNIIRSYTEFLLTLTAFNALRANISYLPLITCLRILTSIRKIRSNYTFNHVTFNLFIRSSHSCTRLTIC